MKRRTFIKGLAVAAASLFIPSRSRSQGPSSKAAIPDPTIKVTRRYGPEKDPSHVHDILSYCINQDRIFYDGMSWSENVKDPQRRYNKERSLIINKIRRF